METENIYAKIIADSFSGEHRLTTMEVQCHRFVLAEFNTHRKFSRNSASSRAIPVEKQLDAVRYNPAIPLRFPEEQRGMQGSDEEATATFNGMTAEEHWLAARDEALRAANNLRAIGVHKSVTNRLLEPFMWHRIIVSSTEWDNFFAQRCSPLAQPEIRVLAEKMQEALSNSTPIPVARGQWHLPYIDDEARKHVERSGGSRVEVELTLAKISSARSARVSYLTHEGKSDPAADLRLYHKLRHADPPHWSPLEHPARAAVFPLQSNFDGWTQLRKVEEAGL